MDPINVSYCIIIIQFTFLVLTSLVSILQVMSILIFMFKIYYLRNKNIWESTSFCMSLIGSDDLEMKF